MVAYTQHEDLIIGYWVYICQITVKFDKFEHLLSFIAVIILCTILVHSIS